MPETIQITVNHQLKVNFPTGITYLEVLEKLPKPFHQGVGIKVNGQLKDIREPIKENIEAEVLTFETREGQDIFHHSTAHLMAQAVKELFPTAKVAIGPPIDDGFYYDFEYERPFTPEDLVKIENKMKELAKADEPYLREEISRDKAVDLFQKTGEDYKVEIVEDLDPSSAITLYHQGSFTDLCRGPHLPSTGRIPAFKLLHTAGAYWRGDEKNKMLQRIYGTSFPSQEALDQYLNRLEEIKKRDHRKLGRELDLFSIHEEVGPGLVLWHPKGAMVRKTIEDYWREEHLENGYELVSTPHIARIDLWKKSGHLEFYKENMFSPIEVDGADFELKPMNCPFHILIFKSRIRSYRDLPIRFAELGTVYRYERSGVLHGLMRVRGFTQDDAHLFCRLDQIEEEILKVILFTQATLSKFGFDEYEIYLSTRPDHYVGSLENWEKATAALEKGLKDSGLSYEIDPGGGAFYGPKIDLKIKDVLGRSWQCSTIQVDFALPQRFDITYRGTDGKEHQPIMIHRALMGSIERFFGVLIEHYAGAFPAWLAPVQVSVIPITDKQHPYANQLSAELEKKNIRFEIDSRNEKLGQKIREAQVQKIPYMLIVGEKEVQARQISIRKRNGEELKSQTLDQFISIFNQDINSVGVADGVNEI
ncbi:MAG: threonine--tRNA ligase [Nitrospirae bacterium]|nr:threonine--tRNA ligase [Nitrospirota bacterium]